MINKKFEIELLDTDSATQAIEKISKLAEANEINWALCGGIAMIFYGSDRVTKDIDVIASRNLPLAKEDVKGFLKQGGEHFLVETEKQKVKIDWIVRNDIAKKFYQSALKDAVLVNGIPIVTPEWLVIMKYIAGRFKDQEDAVYLLKNKQLTSRRKIKKLIIDVVGEDAWTGYYIGLSRWFDIADGFIRQGNENESYRTEEEYLDS